MTGRDACRCLVVARHACESRSSIPHAAYHVTTIPAVVSRREYLVARRYRLEMLKAAVAGAADADDLAPALRLALDAAGEEETSLACRARAADFD